MLLEAGVPVTVILPSFTYAPGQNELAFAEADI